MKNLLLSRGVIHEPWVYVYLKNHILPTDKVLIIAYAFGSAWIRSEEDYDCLYGHGKSYHEKIINSFLPYQVLPKNIDVLDFFKDDHKTSLNKIINADILYFPGGLPDKMMIRIIEKGIAEAIQAHQGLVIGSSAGAMIQLNEFHITPDFDYKKWQYEKGLNLLDSINIEVHYENNFRTRRSHQKLAKKGDKPIYLIPDDGGILIADNRIILLGNAKLKNN